MSTLAMKRGDTPTIRFTVTNLDGTPTDLSTVDGIRLTVKRHINHSDLDALVAVALGTGLSLVTDGTDGLVDWVPEDDAFDSISKETELVYDLQVTDGTGKVYTVDSGTLTIELDVTRTTP